MELLAKTRLPFPRPIAYTTYRDELPKVTPYLPNVSSIVVKERSVEGDLVRLTNIWTAKADIPSLARKFITDQMLMWTDFADWDQPGWICRWRIETHAFPGLVECTGTTAFHETGADTEIEIRGNLILHLEKAHVPRLLAGTVGPIVEKVVVNNLKPNLLSAGEGVAKFLAAQGPR
jgi:hypothetical protein